LRSAVHIPHGIGVAACEVLRNVDSNVLGLHIRIGHTPERPAVLESSDAFSRRRLFPVIDSIDGFDNTMEDAERIVGVAARVESPPLSCRLVELFASDLLVPGGKVGGFDSRRIHEIAICRDFLGFLGNDSD
jgi:hypothetical protein